MSKYFSVILILILVACTQRGATEKAQSSEIDLAARGKSIYMSSCTACHNADPGKDGSVGPAVKGSSLELLTAKVMKNTYPDGYQPKRLTLQMVPLQHLEKELPAIHAFLGNP